MSRLHRFYRRWLPIALGLTVVTNLVLDRFLPMSDRPLRFHEAGSLTHLVHNDQPTVARSYSLYLELGDAAGGATLVLPPDSALSAQNARGLSDVTVIVKDYDPSALPSEARPEGPAIGDFSTPDGDVPYWILPGNDDRWWLAHTPEGIVVVPESLSPVPREEP